MTLPCPRDKPGVRQARDMGTARDDAALPWLACVAYTVCLISLQNCLFIRHEDCIHNNNNVLVYVSFLQIGARSLSQGEERNMVKT